jgi:flagellar biosynthesis/type III secretory pathway chaperone
MTPITSQAEAASTVDDLTTLFKNLSHLLQDEMASVHAGRVRKAAEIEPAKRDLAGKLYTLGERIRANAKFVMQAVPERCAALKSAQEDLRAVLQRNMIVLATAHAVSEGIVRRLSGQLAKKASPQVYGATGRAVTPNPRHGRPLAISRTL